jgi:methylenetetrahydrofolate reductase (NADPH)
VPNARDPVYAGVMVVGSAQMAAKLSGQFPQLAPPAWLAKRLETDKEAGVQFACDLVCQIRDSGTFEGAHLVPVRRYREVARRLEVLL